MIDAVRMAALLTQSRQVLGSSIANEFAADPQRFATMHVALNDLLFDYSKQRLSKAALAELVALATGCGVEAKRDAMFRGDLVNVTARRASHRLAQSFRRSRHGRGRQRHAGDYRRTRQSGGFRQRRARGAIARRARPADDECRQYRHRRL
jgi:hypothetical protein